MPNYIVTANSKFQPYTYEQLIAPLKEYGQAYAAQEAAASDLESKANAVEARLNPDLDSQAYAVMKAYTDKIKDYANTLSREGLSMQTRKDIIRHKNAFESEVGPVQNAIKWKDEQMKKWQDYSLQNPSAFANFNPATTSVDYYMQHPSATFNSLVGDKLTDEAAKFYANFQRNLRDKGQENTWKPIIGGAYYEKRRDHGYKPEELQYLRDQVMYDIQNGTVDASKLREDYQYLYQGLVDMYNRTGVDSWKNLNGEDDITSRGKVLDYLTTGLAWAINGPTFKELSNPYAVPRSSSGSGNDESYNPVKVVTAPSGNSNQSDTNLSEYSLDKDGYITDPKAEEEYNKYLKYVTPIGQENYQPTVGLTPAQQLDNRLYWIDKAKNDILSGVTTIHRAGSTKSESIADVAKKLLGTNSNGEPIVIPSSDGDTSKDITVENIVNAVWTGDIEFLQQAKSKLSDTASPLVDELNWKDLFNRAKQVNELNQEQVILENLKQAGSPEAQQQYLNGYKAELQQQATDRVLNNGYTSAKNTSNPNYYAKLYTAMNKSKEAWQEYDYDVIQDDATLLDNLGKASLKIAATAQNVIQIDADGKEKPLDKGDFMKLVQKADDKQSGVQKVFTFNSQYGPVVKFVDGEDITTVPLNFYNQVAKPTSQYKAFRKAAFNFSDTSGGATIPVINAEGRSSDDLNKLIFAGVTSNEGASVQGVPNAKQFKVYTGNDILNVITLNNDVYVFSAQDIIQNKGRQFQDNMNKLVINIYADFRNITETATPSKTKKKDTIDIYSMR